MKEFYIVWNEGRSEGFITDDEADARNVVTRNFRGAYTTAGADFAETYGDEKLSLEKVVLPVKNGDQK